MLLPHWLLYFPWKCNWGAGMLPPFIVQSNKGVLGDGTGKAWGERWGKGCCWERKFQHLLPLAAAAACISGVAAAILPFLRVLRQEKTSSQVTVTMIDQSEVFQTYSQWVHLCCIWWDRLVSIVYFWFSHPASTLSLRSSSGFRLVQATYKSHLALEQECQRLLKRTLKTVSTCLIECIG